MRYQILFARVGTVIVPKEGQMVHEKCDIHGIVIFSSDNLSPTESRGAPIELGGQYR